MNKLLTALLLILLPMTVDAQQAPTFANAKWIAMEPDSTIIFPHIHLLKANSAEGQSLKRYALPVFTKQFALKKTSVSKATAYVCGLGQYELFINGEKVGRNFLDPGWTMYDKQLLYNAFDVTDAISGLRKVDVKVMLGGGMYDVPLQGYHKFAGSCGAPKMLFALHIAYKNGKQQTIVHLPDGRTKEVKAGTYTFKND